MASGEWYRLFTGAFLHAGIIHIGMNMLVLWLVGNQLERVLGHWRYLSLYMAALLAGSFAVMLYDPGILTVGASGAIFGLFGAMLAYQRDRGINLMQSGLGGLILINLLITFALPGISKAGHLGGPHRRGGRRVRDVRDRQAGAHASGPAWRWPGRSRRRSCSAASWAANAYVDQRLAIRV